jgi:hypothetical protein
MDEALQLREKVASLADALLSKHPRMPTLLREIHTTLLKYPEQVTLLAEDDISTLVSALQVQTGISFAASASKPAGVKSATAKIKQLGVDAF